MEALDPAVYRDLVRRALEEDVRDGDVTTEATVTAAQRARGVFLAKAPCVIAGLDVAFDAFLQVAAAIAAPAPACEAAKPDSSTS